ncbi:MAG: class I SAM-dependent methyltransferase [Chloroflexi bacterium]|nr:class I SAM-dependent methyltransferase [Chloroflexota bacterium]
MFNQLVEINTRPEPFQFYTAADLWTDEHTSRMMLEYHLNEDIDLSSRNSNFIERSIEWIVSRIGVKENTNVADFGCGPGLYTIRFAERQADVTGIDFSENSIRYAQNMAAQKGLNIKYLIQNYFEFEPEDQFDLITMIMCDFCALSPVQRKVMLNKFHSCLKPHGAVLLDVYSLNTFNQREEVATYEKNYLNGFWSKDDYYSFVNTFKYKDEKVILDKHTIIEESRIRTVYNWLQNFSCESLGQEFEDCGFEVEEFYSDIAGKPYDAESMEIAVVARKL